MNAKNNEASRTIFTKAREMWQQLCAGYVAVSFRRPGLLLAGFLILAVLGAWLASSTLRVETNLEALLPEGTASVAALRESKERIGSTDFFSIAIKCETSNPKAIAELQDKLKTRIEKEWEDAEWVQIDRDTTFFREHALYYLPEEKLEELKALLQEELIRINEEIYGSVLSSSDDKNGDSDKKTLETWYDTDLPRQLGLPPQVEEEFNAFFEAKKAKEKPDPSAPKPVEKIPGRLIGPEGKVGVVLVQLHQPSTQLEYAQFALERGEKLISEIDPKSIDSGLQAQVVGAYRSFKEASALSDDGFTATLISVSLIALLMALFWRSPAAVGVVMLPLMVAGGITMGITGIVFGRLTAFTIFILAILVGMGIDYGIHLYGRIGIELKTGQSLEKAVTTSLSDTGTALLAAAATTIAGLLTLLLGHFDGFKEFGMVASYGLLLCVLGALFVTPPTLALLQRLGLRSLATRESPPVNVQAEPPRKRLLLALVLVGVVVTCVLGYFAPRAKFENDFRKLRGAKTGATIGYGKAVGKRSGTAPAVFLGRTRAQMSAVQDFMLTKLNEDRDPRVSSVITLYTFVPEADRQTAREKLIKEIHEIVKKRIFNRTKGEKKRLITELRSMAQAKPFTEDDIPIWARKLVSEKNGDVGLIGHMYTKIRDWDAYEVRAFKNDYQGLKFEGKQVPVASSGFILADVVEMVQQDGKRLFLFVTAALLLILLAFTRSIRATLVLMGVILVSGVWIAGIMGLFDLRLGLYNVLVVPVLLGVGVDSAVHLYHRHLHLGPQNILYNLRTTGVTIVASSLTTVAGFSGLLFVSHKGLQTIGVLATIGVGAGLVAVSLFLPFLLVKLIPSQASPPNPLSTNVERGNPGRS